MRDLRQLPAANRSQGREVGRRLLQQDRGLHQLRGHTDWVWSVAWSSDSTRLLTAGDDATVRVWDAATGHPAEFAIVTLPRGELALFDAVSDKLIGASAGAWRWLGYNVIEDGLLTRVPAETFGPLPPPNEPRVHRPAASGVTSTV